MGMNDAWHLWWGIYISQMMYISHKIQYQQQKHQLLRYPPMDTSQIIPKTIPINTRIIISSLNEVRVWMKVNRNWDNIIIIFPTKGNYRINEGQMKKINPIEQNSESHSQGADWKVEHLSKVVWDLLVHQSIRSTRTV